VREEQRLRVWVTKKWLFCFQAYRFHVWFNQSINQSIQLHYFHTYVNHLRRR
jgi:hypothetical protein